MKRAGSASSLVHLRDVCGKTRARGVHSIYAKIASMPVAWTATAKLRKDFR